MKKLSLQHVILLCVSLMLFASCMGEGSNRESGYIVGVVRLHEVSGIKVLYIDDYNSLYSIAFANTNLDACLQVYYELDYDLPENSYDNLIANGYYTVTILDKMELDPFVMSYSLTDTSRVLNNELPITEPLYNRDIIAYIKGWSFICNVIELPEGQEMSWDLSCDMSDYVKEENNQRKYDVFLRSYLKPGATASTKSNITAYPVNAYNMRSYMDRIARDEKALGSTSFTIRFNYPSKIEDDVITWSSVESNAISVDVVIPEE